MSLAEQHRWYASVLRGHYGWYGMPHNWRSMNEFPQEVRRIWFTCLRRRSQKSRVRESRLPGSVKAEPNGRATRPRS
ncbi:MAG: hypothetical protein ACP5M5_12195 [Acidibrevibacterium sp.]|uniref:hypothetical protein n=1 Tax=Acidibrevibacterium sp. TaxID=2606776 RepID=UPI003D04B603